jgi:hypothetical protein
MVVRAASSNGAPLCAARFLKTDSLRSYWLFEIALPLTEAISLPEDPVSSAHAGLVKKEMATVTIINKFIPWKNTRIVIFLSIP